MIDLTPIFQAIIALLAAIITYKVVPWLKSRMTESQYRQLKTAADIAVYAAEQLYGAGQGEEKLAYALGLLESQGFTLDAGMLRAAIEDAVYKQTPSFRDLDNAAREELKESESAEGEIIEAENNISADDVINDPDWDESK